jgi:hypothetical protein
VKKTPSSHSQNTGTAAHAITGSFLGLAPTTSLDFELDLATKPFRLELGSCNVFRLEHAHG